MWRNPAHGPETGRSLKKGWRDAARAVARRRIQGLNRVAVFHESRISAPAFTETDPCRRSLRWRVARVGNTLDGTTAADTRPRPKRDRRRQFVSVSGIRCECRGGDAASVGGGVRGNTKSGDVNSLIFGWPRIRIRLARLGATETRCIRSPVNAVARPGKYCGLVPGAFKILLAHIVKFRACQVRHFGLHFEHSATRIVHFLTNLKISMIARR